MSNKRYKKQLSGFIYKNQPTSLTLGSLVVAFLCLLLLIMATFTELNIAHFWFESGLDPQKFKHLVYIPQIPVVLLTAALLGERLSMLVVFCYVVLGLFFMPVFSLGGGLDYIANYSFGYILGFFPAVWITGKTVDTKKDPLSLIKGAALGVLAIHCVGIVYSLFIGFWTHTPFEYILSWIYHLTVIRIIYDFVISLIAMFFARYLKAFLYIAMG